MSSVFEKWIEANDRLVKCYDAVSADQYKALSAKDQGLLCQSEKEQVRSFLKNDQIHFRNIIQERIKFAGAQ